MVGNRLASMVWPYPGGPPMIRLWSPPAITSMPRLTFSLPRFQKNIPRIRELAEHRQDIPPFYSLFLYETDNFFGETFEIIQELSQDADNDFRIDTGVIMHDNISEFGHLDHSAADVLGNDPVFE